MQQVHILENGHSHPAQTKKEIREVMADPVRGVGHIYLGATSPWEYEGILLLAPRQIDHWVVGPDPWERRNWYGQFHWNDRKSRWEFK